MKSFKSLTKTNQPNPKNKMDNKTADDYLEKNCPSMNNLYLDKQGQQFKARILTAMDQFTQHQTEALREENSELKRWRNLDELAISTMQSELDQLRADNERMRAANDKINYGSLPDPEKLYPTCYQIKQNGEKVFGNFLTKGIDLTEPQIKYLYEIGYFKQSITPKD